VVVKFRVTLEGYAGTVDGNESCKSRKRKLCFMDLGPGGQTTRVICEIFGESALRLKQVHEVWVLPSNKCWIRK
jgi:hypothetical protein